MKLKTLLSETFSVSPNAIEIFPAQDRNGATRERLIETFTRKALNTQDKASAENMKLFVDKLNALSNEEQLYSWSFKERRQSYIGWAIEDEILWYIEMG